MKMRENLYSIYSYLASDETLLRLLYYKAKNYSDSPLDPSKDNILDFPEDKKWEIIDDRLKGTEKVDDLDKEKKCRILFYAGNRDGTENYILASQEIVFDVLVNIEEYDQKDLRMSWICDHLNDLVSGKKITGIGKMKFLEGSPIKAPIGYLGYRLVYTIGSASE